eukprot:870071-Pleurochrysis_carterae.AAC.4
MDMWVEFHHGDTTFPMTDFACAVYAAGMCACVVAMLLDECAISNLRLISRSFEREVTYTIQWTFSTQIVLSSVRCIHRRAFPSLLSPSLSAQNALKAHPRASLLNACVDPTGRAQDLRSRQATEATTSRAVVCGRRRTRARTHSVSAVSLRLMLRARLRISRLAPHKQTTPRWHEQSNHDDYPLEQRLPKDHRSARVSCSSVSPRHFSLVAARVSCSSRVTRREFS